MDSKETHNAILKKFGFRRKRKDNNPWSSGKGYGRKHLAEMFGEIGFNRGAEIGVRLGRFSQCLLDANPDLMLYCIDPWGQYHGVPQARQDRLYRQAVERLTPYNVKILRKSSMDALADIEDESLDFVYIDGNHTFDYCCPDIIFWSRKVKSGGIVACHDYLPFRWNGVIQAVDSYTHCHHIDPWFVTKEREPSVYWVKP